MGGLRGPSTIKADEENRGLQAGPWSMSQSGYVLAVREMSVIALDPSSGGRACNKAGETTGHMRNKDLAERAVGCVTATHANCKLELRVVPHQKHDLPPSMQARFRYFRTAWLARLQANPKSVVTFFHFTCQSEAASLLSFCASVGDWSVTETPASHESQNPHGQLRYRRALLLCQTGINARRPPLCNS